MNIVGLLGPAGSGKDLVADWLVQYRNYVKVSFADVMKRIARDLFNFDTGILWGPSQMRNELRPVDWALLETRLNQGSIDRWKTELLMNHPKIEEFPYRLKEWYSSLREKSPVPHQISARIVLQTMGTEFGRRLDPLLWVNYVYDEVVPKLSRVGWGYEPWHGVIYDHGKKPPPTGIVIPDHRFRNEVSETMRRGGYMLRLRRASLEAPSLANSIVKHVVGLEGHASEEEQKALPDSVFDRVLHLPEGVNYVYMMLNEVFGKEQEKWMRPRSPNPTEP
jgi:hypothetical protein